MQERVYLKRYDSAGEFPDRRIKLNVYFEDSKSRQYVWTPEWEAIRNLFLESSRVEKRNKAKGREVGKFEETAKKVLSQAGIESYEQMWGEFAKIEEEKVIVCYWESGREYQRAIPVSVAFRAKIIEEESFLSWTRGHVGQRGMWLILNGELFDVEWEERPEPADLT